MYISVFWLTIVFVGLLELSIFFSDGYALFFCLLLGLSVFAQRVVTRGLSRKTAPALFVEVSVWMAFLFVVWRVFSDRHTELFLFLAIALLFRLIWMRWSLRGDTLIFFFGVSSWTLLFFIDAVWQQHLFAMLSGGLFFWMLWGYRRWRGGLLAGMTKSALSAITIATAFLFFSVLMGTLINYAFPVWAFVLILSVGAYLLTHQYLAGISEERGRIEWYSVAVGVFFAELGWIVQFWSFGYLTTGVILLILYYALWDMLGSYTEGTFTRSRAWGDVSLFVVLVGLVLLSTPWTLIR